MNLQKTLSFFQDLHERLRTLSVKFEEASVEKVEQWNLVHKLKSSLEQAAEFEKV